MNWQTRAVLCLSVLLLPFPAQALAATKIHLIVHIPADTPAGENIFIAGSLPSVGSWKADGLKLDHQPNGSFTAEVPLEFNDTLEYKITRGTWATVETSADRSDRPNRTLVVGANPTTVEINVDRWSAGAAKKSTVVGELQLRKIESAALKQSRLLRVWLPKPYEENSDVRYDVLYMHDGQNLFDEATSPFGHEWQIDETLTKLIAQKKIPPLIVVGIDNNPTDRLGEYTYAPDPRHGGGHAAIYVDFLLNEVKPYIEKNYRVQSGPEHTFLGGSSLGGLISLEITRRHPGIFGGVIAMSPSLWWRGDPIVDSLKSDPAPLTHTRIWIDAGTSEEDTAANNDRDLSLMRQLDSVMTNAKVDHRMVIDKDAKHNEIAWARRFPQAIQFLMTDK